MTHGLTAEEIAVLKDGGFDLEVRSGDDPFYTTARQLVELIRASLSPDTAAKRLGVTLADVQQMIAERGLYAIASTSGWLIPAFQFENDKLVQGIDTVNPCISDALSLVTVYRWYTQPDPELEIDEQVWVPLEWLRAGRSADIVAHAATALSTEHVNEATTNVKPDKNRTLAEFIQANDKTLPIDMEGLEIRMGAPAARLVEI